MSILKRILRVITPCLLITLIGCSVNKNARPQAESFFKKIIANKEQEAAKLIDPTSNMFSNRWSIISSIKNHKAHGKLNSIGGGIFGSVTKTKSTFTFTKVDLSVKLNYDSTSIMAGVTLIDRGKGFLITHIEL